MYACKTQRLLHATSFNVYHTILTAQYINVFRTTRTTNKDNVSKQHDRAVLIDNYITRLPRLRRASVRSKHRREFHVKKASSWKNPSTQEAKFWHDSICQNKEFHHRPTNKMQNVEHRKETQRLVDRKLWSIRGSQNSREECAIKCRVSSNGRSKEQKISSAPVVVHKNSAARPHSNLWIHLANTKKLTKQKGRKYNDRPGKFYAVYRTENDIHT